MDKFSFFTLNILINSTLAFFTTAFLIEGIIFLFKVKQGRFAVFLRILPIIKLPLDLLLYNFSKWSYLHGVNPLNCESGTRTLSMALGFKEPFQIISMIKMALPGDLTFTLADIVGYSSNKNTLNYLTILFVFTCTYSLIRKLISYKHFTAKLNNLEKTSQTKKVKNPYLKQLFRKNKLQIITCLNYSGSPFVAGILSSNIHIPFDLLKNLTQEEYEAILAHEIEHIRYRDNLLNITLSIIESIFWWIPTRWLRKRIKEGQEIGCDRNCKRYKINSIDLASAIYKAAKVSLKTPNYFFANYLSTNTIRKRINLLLKPNDVSFRLLRVTFFIFIGYVICSTILFGRFWTF